MLLNHSILNATYALIAKRHNYREDECFCYGNALSVIYIFGANLYSNLSPIYKMGD